jgi:tetraacyldisaccharide 4'-kinase
VQHRYVTPSFSILLTNYHRPFYEDHLLPVGRLREQKRGYKRADIIVVTRTPVNLLDVEKKMSIKKIDPLSNQKVFFSSVVYDEPLPVYPRSTPAPKIDKTTSVVLLTGIANSNDIRKDIEAKAKEVIHKNYPDHHWFSPVDIMKVVDAFNSMDNPDKIIITTEKDSVRLHQPALVEQLGKLPIFYIPIRVRIHDEQEFEALVIRYLNSFHLYKPLQKQQ